MPAPNPIINRSGYCLDVQNGTPLKAGQNVQIFFCNTNQGQQFVWDDSTHQIKVTDGTTTLCLDVLNGNAVSGANVQVFTCKLIL